MDGDDGDDDMLSGFESEQADEAWNSLIWPLWVESLGKNEESIVGITFKKYTGEKKEKDLAEIPMEGSPWLLRGFQRWVTKLDEQLRIWIAFSIAFSISLKIGTEDLER